MDDVSRMTPEQKLLYYKQMQEKGKTDATKSASEWKSYLRTSARNYRHPYYEQIMIWLQKPDAIACGNYRLWVEKMGRYIRRGEKGIAIVDTTTNHPYVKYLFDVSQTGETKNSRDVILWQVKDEDVAPLARILSKQYLGNTDRLEEAVDLAVRTTSEEFISEVDIGDLSAIDSGGIGSYDNDKRIETLSRLLYLSVEYEVLSRCLPLYADLAVTDEACQRLPSLTQ